MLFSALLVTAESIPLSLALRLEELPLAVSTSDFTVVKSAVAVLRASSTAVTPSVARSIPSSIWLRLSAVSGVAVEGVFSQFIRVYLFNFLFSFRCDFVCECLYARKLSR